MANGGQRDGKNHEGWMGKRDEFSSVRTVLYLLQQGFMPCNLGFLHCRCCRWLWRSSRIYWFVVTHLSSRWAKKKSTTDLPIIPMLRTWNLVSTNSTCSPMHLPSRSEWTSCGAVMLLVRSWLISLFASRQSKNMDMEVTAFRSLSVTWKIKHLQDFCGSLVCSFGSQISHYVWGSSLHQRASLSSLYQANSF